MLEISESLIDNAVIKVIGVGGGGGNAVQHMVNQNIEGVEFICVNTDSQALKESNVNNIIQIGSEFTKGLGAGANPEIGKRAAQEDRSQIQKSLVGADMVFVTAGMGGGTGTGAAPVIAEVAKEMGILTVAVVTKPFGIEGSRRMKLAMSGIEELSQIVDSLIIIPNDKLPGVLGEKISIREAFGKVDEVLQGAVQGIAELITRPGLINVDFADVRTVMSAMGLAVMGTATATGENRAFEAAKAAVSSPLLEDDLELKEAKGVLVNITAGENMSIGEFQAVGEVIQEFASDQATVVIGTVIDQQIKDELSVTIVVTGLEVPVNNSKHKHSGNNYRKSVQFSQSMNSLSKSTAGILKQQVPLKNDGKYSDLKYVESERKSHEDIPNFLRRKVDWYLDIVTVFISLFYLTIELVYIYYPLDTIPIKAKLVHNDCYFI